MVNPHDHQVYAVKELTNLTLDDGSTDEAAMLETSALRAKVLSEGQFELFAELLDHIDQPPVAHTLLKL